jgi:plasmid stabilization system protein ParE
VLKLFQRPRFLLDLGEELEWLNQRAGPEIAGKWYDAVTCTIDDLQQHPGLGRNRPDLSPAGIRSWRIKHYERWLLFYLVRKDAIVLLRIRQGTMNLGWLKMDR